MAPQLILPSFTFDTGVAFHTTVSANATSSCLQHAEKQNYLCQCLFILGVFLPVIIWPLLPSTSEVVSYRILAFSSLAQFVSTVLWDIYAITTGTDDTLPSSFRRIWFAFFANFLIFYITLGIVGHGAEKCGKRLEMESFHVAACATVAGLPNATPILGEYLFNWSKMDSTIAGCILMAIAWRPGTKLVMTTYYHFMTRRISSLYWLPQNGSEAHFNPWWSRLLRFIWISYTLLLVYVSLATIHFTRECQLQLGQSYPTNG